MFVLVIGAIVFAVLFALDRPVGAGKLLIPSAAFLLAYAISAQFADDKWLALVGRHNSYALGMVGMSLVLIYHIASTGVDLEWMGVAGALLGVHALAQVCGIDGKYAAALTGNRAIGTMGSPVDLGIVLAMLLPVSLSRSLVYGAAVGLGILATGSRGALLSGTIGVIAWRMRP